VRAVKIVVRRTRRKRRCTDRFVGISTDLTLRGPRNRTLYACVPIHCRLFSCTARLMHFSSLTRTSLLHTTAVNLLAQVHSYYYYYYASVFLFTDAPMRYYYLRRGFASSPTATLGMFPPMIRYVFSLKNVTSRLVRLVDLLSGTQRPPSKNTPQHSYRVLISMTPVATEKTIFDTKTSWPPVKYLVF
jgi:hypothetical protein